ncbi:MAG: hypothetical protein RMH97_10955 [Verrucomicrobiales bacterium]|nr:hypothetical protein [Verrucomicrobiales bacterium]
MSAPPVCPICGARVPVHARACPECGSDEHTGWSAAAYEPRPDGIPDEEFDYAEFVQREFGNGQKPKTHPWKFTAACIVFLIILALVLLLLP